MNEFLEDFEKFVKKVDKLIPGDWMSGAKTELGKTFIENYTEIKTKEMKKNEYILKGLKKVSNKLDEPSCEITAQINKINRSSNLSLILSVIVFAGVLILNFFKK
ncbi:hypothetical protein [Cetobacterium sp.]|uniref:hypothetical protein n=1 Tax=Cetobacterium sp. TaxID=2071632 RepID=UPI003EE54925